MSMIKIEVVKEDSQFLGDTELCSECLSVDCICEPENSCSSCGSTNGDFYDGAMCDECYINSFEYVYDTYVNGNISHARTSYRALSDTNQKCAIELAHQKNDTKFISLVTFD